jgi:uncharacterized damage-inducible protein DinB
MNETAQQYTERILGYLAGKDAMAVQRSTVRKIESAIRRLDKRQMTRRPAPGKWSIAEILAHLVDTEIVGSYRMRLILGSNGTPIQPFDQDVWATTFDYARRDPKVSLATFRVLRENNLSMLKALPKSLWENHGMHAERGKETISRIVAMFAGHDLNHLGQIEKMVKDSRRKS